jgi:L-malate glycosyltransferase
MARVTVLFATLNGAHTLPRMLDSLENVAPPTGGWKVVAVDNGSTDSTRDILEQRAVKLPMTVLTEPRRGKNAALNAGLAFVDGDLVALTDDDIILPADWLVSIEKIAAERAEYDIFGGPIYPIWEEPPSAWVLRCAPKDYLGLTNFCEGPVLPGFIWGGNMAVRAVLFREHRFGEEFYMCSETEFTGRANRSGHKCWHFHASPVGHIIRSYQLEPRWHLQRAYRFGRADYRVFHTNAKGALAQRYGDPLYRLVMLAKGACRVTMAAWDFAGSHFYGDADDQFKASLQLRYWRGNFAERYAIVADIDGRKQSPSSGSPGLNDSKGRSR